MKPIVRDRPLLICWFVMSFRELRTLQLSWWLRPADELRIAGKVMTGYAFDNPHFRVKNSYGEPFIISVYHCDAHEAGSATDKAYRKRFGNAYKGAKSFSNVWSLHLWSIRNEHLFATEFCADYGDAMPATVLDQAFTILDAWTAEGKLPCSDCKVVIRREAVAGSYFAGSYCHACWAGDGGTHAGKGGWKAVEAKETYE